MDLCRATSSVWNVSGKILDVCQAGKELSTCLFTLAVINLRNLLDGFTQAARRA